MIMKKRLSFLLALVLCISLLPLPVVQAAENNTNEVVTIAAQEKSTFSDWALADLIVGDTYGIYPLSWYEKGLTDPMNEAQLRILVAGLRYKILNTDCVTAYPESYGISVNKPITAENVLDVLFQVVSGYGYNKDLGLDSVTSPLDFMVEKGIFTGNPYELALEDRCTIEQACVYATRLVTYLYDALDAASKGFFWEAKSQGNTVYMLGSIHLASHDIYPLSKKILEAFHKSDALFVELNLLNTNGAAEMLPYAMYTDGSTLKDHVSDMTYQMVMELAAMFGISENEIAIFKPWFIYTMFSGLNYTDSGDQSDASLAAQLGIDMKLTLDAMLYGKPIYELEGYAYQAQVLDSFSDDLEEYLLVSTLISIYNILEGETSVAANVLDNSLEYWREGDIEGFLEMSKASEYTDTSYEISEEEQILIDEFNDKLLTQRDKHMADYIDDLLQAEGNNTYFVVVGSAHYVSDYSVLDILTERGYEINQIK